LRISSSAGSSWRSRADFERHGQEALGIVRAHHQRDLLGFFDVKISAARSNPAIIILSNAHRARRKVARLSGLSRQRFNVFQAA
jgi:hypothetical protein